MVRRNKLLGMWAAEKLGLVGESAKAYSDELAEGTLDVERADVLRKVREDFNAAGVVQTDEQILCVMSEFWLEAGNQKRPGRADATDVALVQIARNLQTK
ncbi:DUF1476 family protein [Sinorhizobium mexicanum]|uniref:DUF1476 family protein n=2 Tax=Sinorhizobium mexicanum TaxID=375549 RepID=A0A859QKJ9_9HYPH|nr:DUF1476 family protein [Sinorhizobium mexicanum]